MRAAGAKTLCARVACSSAACGRLTQLLCGLGCASSAFWCPLWRLRHARGTELASANTNIAGVAAALLKMGQTGSTLVESHRRASCFGTLQTSID